jgi:hypothetical protein
MLHRIATIALLAVLTSAPVCAAELDKFLPPDTEVLVRVNLAQAFDSKLGKPGVEQLRGLIKQVEELDAAFKEMEFDPFLDLDTLIAAAPNSSEQDRGLVIVHGKFKLDKFKAKGEAVAKDMGEMLKLHKVADGAGGQVTLYEVRPPDQDQAVFVALPNDTTMLISSGKDYVADAIKRGKAKDAVALKNKAFQALIEKMNPKQTIAVAAIGEALAKGVNDETVKAVLAKVDAVGGGITLGDDLKLEVVIGARTEQEAKELSTAINDGVTKGLVLVGVLATQQKELASAVDVLKTIRSTAKDKAVTIRAEVSAEAIQAIQKALAGN